MTNLDEDRESLQVMLDDFADEYGDQELIEGMKTWLNTKMGGSYIITRVWAPAPSQETK